MLTHRRALLGAAGLALSAPFVIVQAQAPFNFAVLGGKELWVGMFSNDACGVLCRGAARLKFSFDGSQLVSVQSWAGVGDNFAKTADNPNLALEDYGVLPANKITTDSKGQMVLRYPQKSKITLAFNAGVLRGEMDPTDHPARRHWKAVTVEFRPV